MHRYGVDHRRIGRGSGRIGIDQKMKQTINYARERREAIMACAEAQKAIEAKLAEQPTNVELQFMLTIIRNGNRYLGI